MVFTSLECPLAAVDGKVYSLVNVSQYELTFKNMLNYAYFDIQVAGPAKLWKKKKVQLILRKYTMQMFHCDNPTSVYVWR